MPLIIVGLFSLAAGAYFLFSAARQIPVRTMVGLPEFAPHRNSQPMLELGIYSRTRNPIYFAHWLIVLAAAAVSGFVANWIMFALDCLLLPLLIHEEERELLGRFGSEYASYMRRVPRFFPRLR